MQLDGASLDVARLVEVARSGAPVAVSDAAFARIDGAHERFGAARVAGAVYGANTGVGANRDVTVPAGSTTHGVGLLRSHCAAVGPIADDSAARATMVVRLNQLLAGGSGVSGAFARGLLTAIESGSVPTMHLGGSIGTGDLSPLAELALTLTGEREWLSGGIAQVPLVDGDALPFMSSSALTLATAALAAHDLTGILQSATVVAALSFLALGGSREALDDEVHLARPHPQQVDAARALRRLVGSGRDGTESGRVQDPFGLRVLPQVHAPAIDAGRRLVDAVEREINAAVENPLVTSDGVRHHGQFHLATLAAALDHARTSVYPVFTLSASRLSLLLNPAYTGLSPFLASDRPGSSGLMIAEYVVHDTLSELRVVVAPVTGSSVSLSLGTEEHASFATQGARLVQAVAAAAPTVIALEAIAAVRALRMLPERLGDAPAREAYEVLAGELDPEVDDRSLGADIERAVGLLPKLARLADGV